MSKGAHKTFNNDGKGNDKERVLRKKIKELEKEITRLKSELKTLNKAFEKSAAYMSEESKDMSVSDLITAAKKNESLSQTKKAVTVLRPPSKEEVEQRREEAREKVSRWRKETLGEYGEE